MDLPEQVEIKRRHPVVIGDAREEVHEDELTVALATIARLLVRRSFCFCSTLHDDYGGRPSTSDGCTRINHQRYQEAY